MPTLAGYILIPSDIVASVMHKTVTESNNQNASKTLHRILTRVKIYEQIRYRVAQINPYKYFYVVQARLSQRVRKTMV